MGVVTRGAVLRVRSFVLVFLAGMLAAGCAAVSPSGPPLAMLPPAGDTGIFARYMPVLVIHGPGTPWNRVGRVEARGGGPVINPDRPAVYVREDRFSTPRGDYRNLVYRFHFQKVPFSLVPFHLTAGGNVGLFVIITIDSRGRPLLCTTVHTCGCYLAFFPLSAIRDDMLPPGWPEKEQEVLGEKLPARLDPTAAGSRVVLHLRPHTHRVMAAETAVAVPWPTRRLEILPMDALYALPGPDGGKFPFFVGSGPRRGHVRGSHKPFEMLLMGWFALDPFVGEDKDLGPRQRTGTRFYTSLKFWARDSSNMADFATFLRYWGWRL